MGVGTANLLGQPGNRTLAGPSLTPLARSDRAQRCCFLGHDLVSVPGIIDYKWEKAVSLVAIY